MPSCCRSRKTTSHSATSEIPAFGSRPAPVLRTAWVASGRFLTVTHLDRLPSGSQGLPAHQRSTRVNGTFERESAARCTEDRASVRVTHQRIRRHGEKGNTRCRDRNSWRNHDEQPSSSSPAIQACGNDRTALSRASPASPARAGCGSESRPARRPSMRRCLRLAHILGRCSRMSTKSMVPPRDVAQINAYLAVLDFAEPTAPPLPLHIQLGFGPLLGKRRRVEDQHAIQLTQRGWPPAAPAQSSGGR